MLSCLKKDYIEQIYNLQIKNISDFDDNIWSQLEIKNLMEKNGFFSRVFSHKGRVEGFAIFFQTDSYLDIYTLFVSPRYRNNGVADQIIESAFNYCKKKNLSKVTLEVNKRNQKAINFYKKKKFCIKGIRKNYYNCKGNLFDAILMERMI